MASVGNGLIVSVDGFNHLDGNVSPHANTSNSVDLNLPQDGSLWDAEFDNWCGLTAEQVQSRQIRCITWVSPAGPPEDASPMTIMYSALARTEISGSGLVVQPANQGVVGLPQLAHASAPTQSRSVELFGHAINIELWATQYSFDFGDGTPPLVSTEPGASWPDMTNQHDWTKAQERVVVSLTTTWSARMINPFNGEAIVLEDALTTYEESTPFDVRKPRIDLTDTAEELAGH